ncbi:hypothetical protein M011DRAFT_474991 [Sporormia fimetaria CBS 119925]|uniref:Uncharacterized protein n=1 Tax=Sporormia fimetaria CBS 119925 TaxID=1340428 RepID=A0A6A6VGE3_9PLEO|nr:hypothetical protein M011DRAFT_474991 [Sporormia fimetaria CBS 119925]
MAMNYDRLKRLQEAQRRMAKPKIAAQKEIAKQLKRKPNDPYFLAWQVDNALHIGTADRKTLDQILGRKPPIADIDLLDYLYEISVKMTKVSTESAYPPVSAGQAVLDAWSSTADSLPKAALRSQLWAAFVSTAVDLGCWEDARYGFEAYVKARQEADKGSGKEPDKSIFVQRQFFNAMSYSIQSRLHEETGRPLDKHVATWAGFFPAVTKAMLQKSPKSAEVIFLARLWDELGRIPEFWTLWDGAPIKSVITNQSALQAIHRFQRASLYSNQQWKALLDLCLYRISSLLDRCSEVDSDEPLSTHLLETDIETLVMAIKSVRKLEAAENSEVPPAAETVLRNLSDRVASKDTRAAMLAHMLVATVLDKKELLGLCNKFFSKRYGYESCYKDLILFVELLDEKEQSEFRAHISSVSESMANEAHPSEQTEARKRQCLLHLLKFQFFLDVSIPQSPDLSKIETLIAKAIDLCANEANGLSPAYWDSGFLAVHVLATASHRDATGKPTTPGLKSFTQKSQWQNQAAILARHLLDNPEGIKQQKLALYCVRLYAVLGLSGISFDLYPRTRVKSLMEMAASHFLLNRVSLICPFDCSSPRDRTVNQLEQNIRVADDMKANIPLSICKAEGWSTTAFEQIRYWRASNGNISRHLSVMALRQIARLRGTAIEEALEPDISTFTYITDQRDFTAMLDIECTAVKEGRYGDDLSSLPGGYSTLSSLHRFYSGQDTASQLIFDQKLQPTSQKRVKLLAKAVEDSNKPDHEDDDPERMFDTTWQHLVTLGHQLHPPPDAKKDIAAYLQALKDTLSDLKEANDTLKTTCSTTTAPNRENPDTSPLPRSETFIYWFSLLLVLQASHKAALTAIEQLKLLKVNVLQKQKQEALAAANELLASTQDSYKVLMEHVKNWKSFVEDFGARVIGAWARSGETGKAVGAFVPQRAVEGSAREFARQLGFSLEGVLKVKLVVR